MSEPTKAALKAGSAVAQLDGQDALEALTNLTHRLPDLKATDERFPQELSTEVAAIQIDRETGLPELIAALQWIKANLWRYSFEYSDEDVNTLTAHEKIDAALKKAGVIV